MGARRDAFALGKPGKDGTGDKVQLRGTGDYDMTDALDLKVAQRLPMHSIFLSFLISLTLAHSVHAFVSHRRAPILHCSGMLWAPVTVRQPGRWRGGGAEWAWRRRVIAR